MKEPKYKAGDILRTNALHYPQYYLIEAVDDECYSWRCLGSPALLERYATYRIDNETGKGLHKYFDEGGLDFVKVA